MVDAAAPIADMDATPELSNGRNFLFFEQVNIKRVAALGQQHVAILRQHAGGFHIDKRLIYALVPLADLPKE